MRPLQTVPIDQASVEVDHHTAAVARGRTVTQEVVVGAQVGAIVEVVPEHLLKATTQEATAAAAAAAAVLHAATLGLQAHLVAGAGIDAEEVRKAKREQEVAAIAAAAVEAEAEAAEAILAVEVAVEATVVAGAAVVAAVVVGAAALAPVEATVVHLDQIVTLKRVATAKRVKATTGATLGARTKATAEHHHHQANLPTLAGAGGVNLLSDTSAYSPKMYCKTTFVRI